MKARFVGQMGRAPVDQVDDQITAAVTRRDAICARMAAGDHGEAALADLIDASNALTGLQVERDRIIRQFFNGPRKGA